MARDLKGTTARMGGLDSQHDVRVVAEELNPAIRERLDALAEELALARPVSIDGGVWVAATGLSRRRAQSLRRQLQGLGLNVDVVESDGAELPGEDESRESTSQAEDIGLLDWGELEPEAVEPDAGSAPDSRSEELLSWFPDDHEVDEEASAQEEDAGLELMAPDDLIRDPPTEPEPVVDKRPEPNADLADHGSNPSQSTSTSRPGPMESMATSLTRPRSAAAPEPASGGGFPRWLLPAAVVLGLIIVVGFIASSDDPESEIAGPSQTAAQGSAEPPTEYQLAADEEKADEEEAEIEESPEEPDEEKATLSDKAAADALFADGETKCRLKQYEECIATMEAVVTLDPTNDAAYDHIVKAQAAKEARDNPPPTLGPVQPKTVILGPDGVDAEGREGTPDGRDGGGEENSADGPVREDESPTYEIDEAGRKVMVLTPEDQQARQRKDNGGGTPSPEPRNGVEGERGSEPETEGPPDGAESGSKP